jgi:hypothetical protein
LIFQQDLWHHDWPSQVLTELQGQLELLALREQQALQVTKETKVQLEIQVPLVQQDLQDPKDLLDLLERLEQLGLPVRKVILVIPEVHKDQ